MRSILLDIEGTIAPIAFVFDVLFPYARRALPAFLVECWDDPVVAAARRAAEAQRAPGPDWTWAQFTAHLLSLMDADVKDTGLKAIQGLIWARGYQAGELKSELFPDVAPALRAWRAAGLDLRIFSSGSVAAQRVFMRHTAAGDLTDLLSGYYDTTTGPKQSPDSYRAIAAASGVAPAEMLFVSDVTAELDAAVAAGMQTRLAVRPGNRPATAGAHPVTHTFDDLNLIGAVR